MKLKAKTAFITILTLAIILTGCSSVEDIKSTHKIGSGRNMNFFIATDIHYLSKSLTDDGEAYKKYYSTGDGKQLNYIDEILNAFIRDSKAQKPDFMIISGDLTNNGEKQSHLDLSKKLKELEENGTSVYVIPGNHDISNPWARGFKGDKQYITESIDDREFSKIYGDFGYNQAISRDKNSLSYLAAPSEEVWLLMLDTNQYKNNRKLGSPQTDGQIAKGTFEWIKKCSALAKEKGARIITVMHHSLITHSEAVRKGYTLNNSDEALEVFQSLGLDLTLSGHIHVQDISSYKKDGAQMYDIATGALSVYPQKYGILRYSSGERAFDYRTQWVDVEGWAKETGITNSNLSNFKGFTEDFFGRTAYEKALNQLLHYDQYTIEEVKLMAETMKLLNLRHFSGTENLNSGDVLDSAGYKLWEGLPQDSFKNYVTRVISDKDTDDNSLRIELQDN